MSARSYALHSVCPRNFYFPFFYSLFISRFDTTGSTLTYSDQFIEVTTKLATRYVYGLGEHRGRFLKDVQHGQKLTFWTRDCAPTENYNLYGVHPFFLGMEDDGNAYGVFLLNSNAMGESACFTGLNY